MAYCSPCSGLMHCVTNSSSLIGCSVLRVNSDRHTLTGREVGFSYSTAVETTVTMQESSSPALERYWCTFTQYAKWYDAAHLYPTWHHHHHHHGLARVHAAVISSQSQRQQGHHKHNRTTAAPEACMAKGCRTEGGGCLGHRIKVLINSHLSEWCGRTEQVAPTSTSCQCDDTSNVCRCTPKFLRSTNAREGNVT